MAITGRDFKLEERRLNGVLKLLDDRLAQMGTDIFHDEDGTQYIYKALFKWLIRYYQIKTDIK